MKDFEEGYFILEKSLKLFLEHLKQEQSKS
jgi:hypothetical protein